MFAVYRTDSDGCTYSSNTLLFVTESEQTAKDAVALAELEQEEALKVVRPTWTADDVLRNGADWYVDLWEEYSKELAATFTVDTAKTYYVDSDTTYFYERVEVR